MFKLSRRLLIASATALICLPTAFAADGVATREEAVAMVKKAIAFADSNSLDKLYEKINARNPQFIDRDLYVYITSAEGVKAHAANPKLVGKDLSRLKDADGRPFVEEMTKLADTGKPGWVEYRWPNPVTKKIEDKVTYVVKHKDVIFAAGVYK